MTKKEPIVNCKQLNKNLPLSSFFSNYKKNEDVILLFISSTFYFYRHDCVYKVHVRMHTYF